MASAAPAIVKQAETLLVEIERAVHRFSRSHKYPYGMELRALAMKVAKLAHRAWRDRAHQMMWIEKLNWAIDDLKLSLQLGCKVRAFQSFAVFEELARLAADLGRQIGGWHRKQHPKSQNDRRTALDQRAQTLSSRAASAEARS